MILIGRMPLFPTASVAAPYISPPMSPEHQRRTASAQRLGIPSRSVYVVLSQGTGPYGLLFDHMRRGGRSREDAMKVLRRRAPEACRDWFDHIKDWGLWSELVKCHVRDGMDEDTDIRLLKSTLAWLNVQNFEDGVPGPTGAGAPATTGIRVQAPEPDNPKP